MISEDRDPFRYCVYCGVDCYESEPEHATDCPSSTGLFPVTKRDLRGLDRDGELVEHGMLCAECKTPFAVGDTHTYRGLEEGAETLFGKADVVEVICLGCAAHEELAA